ncbi:histidinol-phosphate transaminase [Deinococcus deserti]|uniref:histidinol-phosphate transaminase n=1 Tax=Deinococcus deserti (strain DSM 17065 / CIP 109153 / LMG 22923 / VCD115) TaxID=546414 RepID=C1D353_DEIDV|nr:histidinol-phosphate transaminase [Deinococcus deserti]ACO47842.1 putative histidinol-phosphate aminotransferase [Deinococcus deserti VCD115]
MTLPPLLPRAPHGGPTSASFAGLDFSVNTNPFGPNPILLEAVQRADHGQYPDPTYRAVRETLAAWHGVVPECVALAVGVSDLLHRLVRAFLPPGGTLLSLHAPFGELARAAALQRASVRVVDTLPTVLPPGTRLVYVGHPHNPTGRRLSAAKLQMLAGVCTGAGALLLLDEAYAPFLLDEAGIQGAAVVRLISPGKAHGLVGARPGYALAAPDVVAQLENLAPAWHVPAGTAALLATLPEAQPFLSETLPRVRDLASTLAADLRHLGQVEHHGTPYMTLNVNQGSAVASSLLDHGVRVRDCSSFGLPGCIRVSTRSATENDMLLNALSVVMAST